MLSIIPATKKHLQDLAKVYKHAYKKHNIFNHSLKEILDYLEFTNKHERSNGGGFIVALVEDKRYKNKVVGGILISKIDVSKDKHERWKISHLAIDPKHQGEGYGTQLIESVRLDARSVVKNKYAKSVKLEAHVSANQALFRLQGFRVEGSLEDHFRLGETTKALGLTIK